MSLLKVKQLKGPANNDPGSVISFDGTKPVWSSDLSSALLLPQGPSGARPTSPDTAGYLRFNTDAMLFEGKFAGDWETFATLSSPGFSGSPTAPTPESAASDTRIATTEFVKKAIAASLGNSGGQESPGEVIKITDGVSYACSGTENTIIVKKPIGPNTTILLAETPYPGQRIFIKDGSGSASNFNITITPMTGTIDGNDQIVISQPYEAFLLLYDGVDWNLL
jgi:hypothetical protein